ncbi:MAG TPA: hypothetical protein VED86_07445, partial [archaeon]|nr:hypothetical protein [archaeon]
WRTANTDLQGNHARRSSSESPKVLTLQTKTCIHYVREIGYQALMKVDQTGVTATGKYFHIHNAKPSTLRTILQLQVTTGDRPSGRSNLGKGRSVPVRSHRRC